MKVAALTDLFNSDLPSDARRVVFYELCNNLGLKFEKKVLAKIERSFRPEVTEEIKQAQLRQCGLCLFPIEANERLFETSDVFDTSLLKKNYLKHLHTCTWLQLLDLYGDTGE